MNATKADQTVALAEFGPTSSRIASLAEAQQWCKQLTQSHGENFSVLSRFVAASLVNDFSAVYAFCRAADDLGDETESRERSTELLAWWRDQLHQCFAGHASHPIFVALIPVIARHSLPQEPFDDLISAFEMDQTKTRYETWDEVIGYCKLSADPVGRLVLMLLGERRDEECLRASDAICTALQLTNHWQDARRDLLELPIPDHRRKPRGRAFINHRLRAAGPWSVRRMPVLVHGDNDPRPRPPCIGDSKHSKSAGLAHTTSPKATASASRA
jgi:hypothetical protein